jgi:hypothetical protein
MNNSNPEKLIGFFGFPRRSIIADAKRVHGPKTEFVDLDVDRGAPDSGILQPTTCRIIGNIVDNALALKDRLAVILAAVGEGKCDRGRHAALILREMGLKVVESRFPPEEYEDRPLVYSVCRGPLADRINSIMDTVVDPLRADGDSKPCQPTHGFWGVPPHDFRILEMFPPTTHIYGWTRCVEAGRPGDIELERAVDEDVPTVFFTQAFCAKQDLARYLAGRHGGLYIDCHRNVNDSILSKVEAFIKLS